MTSADRSRSRCLPPLTCALLWAAAMTLAGSDASGQTGAPSRHPGAASPTLAASTASPDTSGETLRRAVTGRFLIGAAVPARRLDDSRLAALVAQQFDCLTAENQFKR